MAREFQIDGDFLNAIPYGSGHINDTYRVLFQQAGAPVSFLLQRINHNVFKNPVALMENIQRVTRASCRAGGWQARQSTAAFSG